MFPKRRKLAVDVLGVGALRNSCVTVDRIGLGLRRENALVCPEKKASVLVGFRGG